MRASLRALATYGAVAAAFVVSPVMAQGNNAAPTGSEQSGGNAAPASAVVPADDLKRALKEIRSSWENYVKCDGRKACTAYFDSFGVAITFSDGSIVPFARVQRLTASDHDCILNARAALDRGDRGLAVQWVMAAKLYMSPAVRDWLGDHPDAVVEALRSGGFRF